MKTALDAPLETLDQQEHRFVSRIREFSWHATHVVAEPGKPNFSYSTGFWASLQAPEWIIHGMRVETAHQIFWNVFRDTQASRGSAPYGRTDSIFDGIPAYDFHVAKRHYANHLGWSRWFYGGDDFPCSQIVWPDRAGLFPWESGSDDALRADQPDLTEHGWRVALAP